MRACLFTGASRVTPRFDLVNLLNGSAFHVFFGRMAT